ncbi:hypothetical protein D3C81_1832730 [compost metagenome]
MLHARGINKSDPPATPEAPAAATADKMLRISAVPKSTSMPTVWTAARVKTEIVTAAPAILIVAPNGMDTEYVSLSSFISSHKLMLTGMLAAELRVKNAVIPLSFRQ